MQYTYEIYRKARMSRDPRFDGKFFTAVKTTKIYCRPICPATSPKEENVTYFPTAIEAANAGYRPCLRCRPDSAPNSPAWKGVNATLDRAIRLIDEGVLQNGSLEDLACTLGISGRHLRQLFKKYLGISPKSYELYQKCLFAKKLLHQTKLPITQVALASGFNSIRRFNDCFQSQLKLTPSQVRKSGKEIAGNIDLQLSYRPPYNWLFVQNFFSSRLIPGLEWCDNESYGRTFKWREVSGNFTVRHIQPKNMFNVSIELSDTKHLKSIVNNIRRLLDLDVDIQSVDQNLAPHFKALSTFQEGLRIPGAWSIFEAGVRAILGQQVSVKAAHTLCSKLVGELGEASGDRVLFPTPEAMNESSLNFLKVPASRKNTLKNLARHYVSSSTPDDFSGWKNLKGIGPWTVNYAQLRGQSDPDIYIGTDLGIKKSVQQRGCSVNAESAAPWRSYLTLQLWSQL